MDREFCGYDLVPVRWNQMRLRAEDLPAHS